MAGDSVNHVTALLRPGGVPEFGQGIEPETRFDHNACLSLIETSDSEKKLGSLIPACETGLSC